MKVKQINNIKTLRIREVDGLDPVTVFLEDYAPGMGCLTIASSEGAWSYFWGAMGDETIMQFIHEAEVEYLIMKLVSSQNPLSTARHLKRLTLIVTAVKQAIALEAGK